MIGAAKIITVQSCKLEINIQPGFAVIQEMVRFVYVHLRSIAEEIYVAKQFCSRLSTENAEVADSELIDENGAQPSSSELDG